MFGYFYEMTVYLNMIINQPNFTWSKFYKRLFLKKKNNSENEPRQTLGQGKLNGPTDSISKKFLV